MLTWLISPVGRAIGGLVLVGVILMGAYWKGYQRASQSCHDKELRAQITSLERQIKNTQDVLAASEEREKAALEEMQNLGSQVTDYAAELEKEKVAANVPQDKKSVVSGPSPYLSRRDVKRLCNISPASCRH